MNNWPTDLPSSPLLEGYKEQPVDSRLVSLTDSGYSKIRNRFMAVPINVTENYLLTKAQRNILLNFYKNFLGNGTSIFIKKNPITETDLIYRFKDVPDITQVGLYFKAKLELEIIPQVI